MFLNSLLVFTFVALWHDLTFKLLAWGWLASLFILPELAARFILPASRVCLSYVQLDPEDADNSLSMAQNLGIGTHVHAALC